MAGQLQLYFTNVHFNCNEQQLRTFIASNTPSKVRPSKCEIQMTPARRSPEGQPQSAPRPKGAAIVWVPQQFSHEVIALHGNKLMGRALAIEVSRSQPSRSSAPNQQRPVQPSPRPVSRPVNVEQTEAKEQKEEKAYDAPNVSNQSNGSAQEIDSRTTIEKMTDELTCHICCCEFTTDGPLMPKNLHASHYFCSSCINVLPRVNNRVRCPLCNDKVLHDPALAVTNIMALRMIEVLAHAKQTAAREAQAAASAAASAPAPVQPKPAAAKPVAAKPVAAKPASPQAAVPVQPAAASSKPAQAVQPKPAQAKPAAAATAAQAAAASARRVEAGLLKLSSRLHYPPFKKLPMLDGFTLDSEKYYAPQPNGSYAIYRHWAFLGEISRMSPYPFRIGVHVKDRDGFEIPVFFYLDNGVEIFKEQLVPGHTMVVRYAESHQYADGQVGLRIEDPKFIRMLPIPLLDLLGLDDRRHDVMGWLERHDESEVPCGSCRKTPAPKRCSACRLVDYCSKECQRTHWPHHKTECKVWTALRDVHDWPPPPENAPRGFKPVLKWTPIKGSILKS